MDKPRHSTDDPRHYTRNIQARLTETINHLREDIEKVHDPKAQALFETTAEVLKGLVTSYEHYEEKRPAWRWPLACAQSAARLQPSIGADCDQNG